MSKERKLLELAVEWIEAQQEPRMIGANDIIKKIRDFLSTPEPTQDEEPTKAEAAAYLYDLDAYCDHRPEQDILAKTLPRLTLERYLKNVRPLYLHPAPRPEFVRLSEEEVNSLMNRSLPSYELICAVENRLVEKNK